MEDLYAGSFIYYKFIFTTNDQFKSVSSRFSLSVLYISRNLPPFLLDCPVCWHITVHSFLLWFFVFLVILVVIFPFNFLFYLGPLFFLLGEPG